MTLKHGTLKTHLEFSIRRNKIALRRAGTTGRINSNRANFTGKVKNIHKGHK
jgi:hypothetical protein